MTLAIILIGGFLILFVASAWRMDRNESTRKTSLRLATLNRINGTADIDRAVEYENYIRNGKPKEKGKEVDKLPR